MSQANRTDSSPTTPLPTPASEIEITPVEFILRRLATEFKIDETVVARIRDLLDAGCSVPFISRYRRDESAGLDERRLYELSSRLAELRHLERRAQHVAIIIEEQGKLTPKLHKRLTTSLDPLEVEDLYLRYRDKPKSPTHADEEAGLGELAETILRSRGPAERSLAELAAPYLKPEAGYDDVAKVLRGAYRLMAQTMAEDAEIRRLCRRQIWKSARITTRPGKTPSGEFKEYQDFSQQVSRILPYRVLTIDRGESRLALEVELVVDHDPLTTILTRRFVRNDSTFRQEILDAIDHALHHLLVPALSVQTRNRLSRRAGDHAIGVLSRNLRTLLMTRPVPGRRVLAIHPGAKSGCPAAALDDHSTVLETTTLNLFGEGVDPEVAKQSMVDLLTRHDVQLVVVGTGTASRDVLKLVSSLGEQGLVEVEFLTVPEAGASAYGASPLAARELPDMDVPHRVAVTLGRRVQQPLVEYLKSPPRAIAMGLHVHDVDGDRLEVALDEVAQSCVADIGLDINRAGAYLLARLPGLDQATAAAVVQYRDGGGRITSREDLRGVPGIDETAWRQVAAFVVIHDGPEPLDATWVHPDHYEAARRLLSDLGLSPADVLDREKLSDVRQRLRQVEPTPEMAERFGMTPLNFQEMMRHLCHPGQDPRKSRPRPILHRRLLTLEQLEPARQLRGIVRNVVDFGAFVDVGAEHDGLVHVTQMSDQFVRQPHDFLSIGDIVTVWVTSVDTDRQRLSLTMLRPGRKEKGGGRGGPRRGKKDRPQGKGKQRGRGGRRDGQDKPHSKSKPRKDRPPRPKPDGNFRKLLEDAGIVKDKDKKKS